jgi:Transcriptional regulator
MDLLQLRYFLAAAEHGNFTKAAITAFTSQSNISKQVANLESELGVALFERSHSGVTVTAAGQKLKEGLTDLLPKMDRLLGDLAENYSTPDTKIHLGFSDSMDFNRVSCGILGRLQNRKIHTNIESYNMEKLTEQVAAGNIDAGFLYSTYNAFIPGLKRVAFTRHNPMLYFSKNHPLAKKENLRIEDFKNETFICRKRDTQRQTYDPFESLTFQPKNVLFANSLNAIYLYIESGTGVAILGQSQNVIGKNTISYLEIPAPDEKKVGVDIVWMDNNNSKSLQMFLQEANAINNK